MYCQAWCLFLAIALVAPGDPLGAFQIDDRPQRLQQILDEPNRPERELQIKYASVNPADRSPAEQAALRMAISQIHQDARPLREQAAIAALALAAEQPQDESALRAYYYALSHGTEEVRTTAARLLVDHGTSSPDILSLLGTFYPPACGDLFQQVADHHPDKAAQGNALYFLTRVDLDQIYRPAESLPDPQLIDKLANRLALIETEYSTYACVDHTRRTLGEAAKYERLRLAAIAPGTAAPEFEGVLLDGTPFKLSECRGKIVVLSFWFASCAPCMSLIPAEQQLVEKYKTKPFLLLGVNRDPREVGLKAATEKWMNWKNFSEGGEARVSNAYFVGGWPTNCVIDAQGVVRLYGEGIIDLGMVEAVVDKLIAEAETGPGQRN